MDWTNSVALPWIRKYAADHPFFLWMHYFDPHAPYNPPELENTGSLYERFRAGLDREAVEVRRDGDPESLTRADDDRFEEVYQVPLLAHVPMEPMNCTAQYSDGNSGV